MSYIQAAFDAVCDHSEEPQTYYVCLIESYRAYGGPEEGGWWYTASNLVAWKEYPAKRLARAAAERVKALAEEMERDALAAHGDYCLRTMEFLDARGLEADFLPEPDGPTQYHVEVLRQLPTFDQRKPQYC